MTTIVQHITPRSVRADGIVRLWGAGFDGSCNVLVGNRPATIVDYESDFIEFVAPGSAGQHTVKLVRGSDEIYSEKLFVVSFENSQTWNLPVRAEDDFRYALLGLMPRGFAWFTGKNGNWWKLFSAFASGFKAVHDSLRHLVDECSPLKTTSYSDWERELGLPLKGLEQSTNAGRKREIVRVSRSKGGCTVPYLRSILKLYGARFDIYEFFKSPSVFPAWVAEKNGDMANFFVLIKVYRDSPGPRGMTCKSKCNASIGTPRDSKLEAIVEKLKPAHIKVVYSYVIRVLTDMGGNPIVDDNNRMIIV